MIFVAVQLSPRIVFGGGVASVLDDSEILRGSGGTMPTTTLARWGNLMFTPPLMYAQRQIHDACWQAFNCPLGYRVSIGYAI